MSPRTIEINPFSRRSIKNAITGLNREKRRLGKEYINVFLQKLAAEIVPDIDSRLTVASMQSERRKPKPNEDFDVTFDIVGNTITFHARGEDVAFLEFGAGVEASGSVNALEDTAMFLPGSWSDEHAGTYEQYKTSGRFRFKDGTYIYFQTPAHAFDEVIEDMPIHIHNAIHSAKKELGFK